ncbi:hypothetical protein CASFOL_022085 [Castilleja foliolosa]|uniref:Uncharacterized protein n=1 Tax=Castilleja foliolosa TaxID=1961234 RepID=A0ABD3CYG2_9LAMI
MEWIKNSRIDGKYYLPILMLRLVMILCSLCINSYVSFDVLFQTLEMPQVRSQLPRGFYEAFSHRNKKNNCEYVAAIAEAFKAIGDPLMIVSSTGARPKLIPSDAVYVNLRSFSCRNEIVNVLFPPVTESSSTVGPTFVRKKDATTSLRPENGKGKMQMKWVLIREKSEDKKSEDLSAAAAISRNY